MCALLDTLADSAMEEDLLLVMCKLQRVVLNEALVVSELGRGRQALFGAVAVEQREIIDFDVRGGRDPELAVPDGELCLRVELAEDRVHVPHGRDFDLHLPLRLDYLLRPLPSFLLCLVELLTTLLLERLLAHLFELPDRCRADYVGFLPLF